MKVPVQYTNAMLMISLLKRKRNLQDNDKMTTNYLQNIDKIGNDAFLELK